MNHLHSQPYYRDTCTAEAGWEIPDGWDPTRKEEIPDLCTCSSGQQVCPKGAEGAPRPYFQTPVREKVLNVTGVPDGLEKFLLRSHSDNILQR